MASISVAIGNPNTFSGAKLLLFVGPELVVLRRDDRPDIPFPGCLDFPGGGRESKESPAACVIRETREEVGLSLSERDLCWARVYGDKNEQSWMFAAHLPSLRRRDLKLGSEGQELALMRPREYAAHALSIPHFVSRLNEYLDENDGCF